MAYCYQPSDQIHLCACSCYNGHIAQIRSSRTGTLVTMAGSGFIGASQVLFDMVAARSLTVNSPTQITAVSPGGSGTVDVRVTTLGGNSSTSPADQFQY